MLENKLSITITDAQVAAGRKAIADFKAAFPFLLSLSDNERQSLPKITSQSAFFVSNGLDAATSNPEFMPPYVSKAELQLDFAAYSKLAPLLSEFDQLNSQMTDTTIVLGSEAYVAMLSYYNTLKNATRHGVAGAKAIYEKLKLRFQQNVTAPKPANP